MTVGGLNIAGIYVNAAEPYVKQYLPSFEYIAKLVLKSGETQEPLLLSWTNNGKRLAFKRYVSVKRSAMEATSIPHKYTSVSLALFDSAWHVQARHVTLSRYTKEAIQDFIEDFLEDEAQKLESAAIRPGQSPAGSSSASASPTTPTPIRLLANVKALLQEQAVDKNFAHVGAGDIHVRAVVQSGSKESFVFQALKWDILKSMRTRLELLSDVLESRAAAPLTHAANSARPLPPFFMPRRVFFRSKAPTACFFCDHVMPEESEQDLLARFDAMLGGSSLRGDAPLEIWSQEKLPASTLVIDPCCSAHSHAENLQCAQERLHKPILGI